MEKRCEERERINDYYYYNNYYNYYYNNYYYYNYYYYNNDNNSSRRQKKKDSLSYRCDFKGERLRLDLLQSLGEHLV